MEPAVGAASWLLGKVLTKLSDDLVAAYVDSLELGHNSLYIKIKLLHTQGLLQVAQGRDVSNFTALQGLLEELNRKADEAEDALDELHYFKIQDQLDGTNYAAPDLGDGLLGHARHGHHAVGHTIGNWFSCFSCTRTQDDDSAPTAVANTTNTDGDHIGKLSFDRVAMSKKLKSVIEDIHSLCDPVSDLLNKIPNNSTAVTLQRPLTVSTIIPDKLYVRTDIFEKTVNDITSGAHNDRTVSVLPIVGPGGIGKTSFTQHLCNDSRTTGYFPVRAWVCVSTNFDVLKLTKEILSCIPADEKEQSNTANDPTNLDKLQTSITERLNSRRFLIVLDDVWKCESKDEWEKLLAPFTRGGAEGSMVLVTTRSPKLAEMMKTINPIELSGLEFEDFFTFFQACIFQHKPKPGHYEDELAGIAREIARKLKGNPLAAKTVGPLLEQNLSHEHWNVVLHNRAWLNQQGQDDIMPSLKISYDYLPFHLKKCLSYCALFPEDYRFRDLEIDRFWIAIGIIDSSHQGNKNYLKELVDNGFLMKGVDAFSSSEHDSEYYVMHDLMHELSRSVSAQECHNINDLDFTVDTIPQSVRHLSITIDNRYDDKFKEEMGKLKGRIDIVNLRTLMVFREYEERITEILKDTFKETNGLRVLFIAVKSLESLPRSFPKLIHLRYLKIGSPYSREMTLPSTLSRFYHLKFLDLKDWHGGSNLPKDFSRLVNLRDFLAKKELHSNVPEVGKMKCIQELKKFHVKKQSVGFELRQLGELTKLGGELSIHNLENVATMEEASGAKLKLKKDLKELTLVWSREQLTDIDDGILDALEPHTNLRALVIKNHCCATCPSWLSPEIRVNKLETLHLHGVSWGTLPPFGQLPYLRELSLKSISGVRQFGPDYGGITGKCFMHLKKVLLHDLSELVEWVVKPNCHMFPSLESIDCSNCPSLSVMPFSECSCTSLCRLRIADCSKLSLPPMPYTSTLTDLAVEENGLKRLGYDGKALYVYEYDGALAFHNLDKVESMSIGNVLNISLAGLEKLKSLRVLVVKGRYDMFSGVLDGSVVSRSVQRLCVHEHHFAGKLLSKILSCFPALSKLKISFSDGELVLQFPSSSSLRTLMVYDCEGLVLMPADSGGAMNCARPRQPSFTVAYAVAKVLQYVKETSFTPQATAPSAWGLSPPMPAEDGGGIQDMASLQSLKIRRCGKFFSRWPVGEAQTINPFLASLRELDIEEESSVWSMALLSNLTSLTHLRLVDCKNLTVDGFNPLITVNLKELEVYNHLGGSIAADLRSEVARTKLIAADSFQLEKLKVDSISAVLVTPICNLLSATLHELSFQFDGRTENFTGEQEKALQLLTSLRKLEFYKCKGLQSLPQGLHHLSSIKKLHVQGCPELRCLPKEGFPTSLQHLTIWDCSAEEHTEHWRRIEYADVVNGSHPSSSRNWWSLTTN